MAGSFADHAEDKIIDHFLGKTSWTMPTVWVGLSTADPLDDASGLAEPVGNNYDRVETGAADWNASSGGSSSNANDIEFPEASGSWGTITHFALFDAESGGNMIGHGNLTVPKPVSSGDTLRFAGGTPGELVTTLS